MIPGIADIEERSTAEKHEVLLKIRSQHGLGDVCKAWGISVGTYYNLMHRWNIDLYDVRRRKRKIQSDVQQHDEHSGVKEVSPTRFTIFIHESLDGESLLNLLQAIRERIAMTIGLLSVSMTIELPRDSRAPVGDEGLLPLEVFRYLDMEEKVRLLAKWLKNGHHKEALLRPGRLISTAFSNC